MTELSPAAQAAWHAYEVADCDPYEIDPRRAGLSDAFSALADQVVPFAEITPQEDLESRRDAMVWGMQHQTQLTRQQLLAIAAELRGDTTTQGDN